MKLASLKSGRDGRLVVVSRDLATARAVPDIAPTLQAALDDWAAIAPKLDDVYQQVDAGTGPDLIAFDPAAAAAPLPRAYQWADGSAYVNHVELVRKARGAEMPKSFWTDPLMYQGGSDTFLRPHEDILLGDVEWGLDMEGEVAVVTDKTDGKLVHLDGLNLSRAWMLEGIILGLPPADPRIAGLELAASQHRKAGLAAVSDAHYEGGHWLGSFAVYLVTQCGLEAGGAPR